MQMAPTLTFQNLVNTVTVCEETLYALCKNVVPHWNGKERTAQRYRHNLANAVLSSISVVSSSFLII
jgi:hypothetical protein